MTFKKEYLGTSLEGWLGEESILQEATASAAKKVIAWQSSGTGRAEEREAKLTALCEMLDASIAQGGSHSADDVRAAVKTRLV